MILTFRWVLLLMVDTVINCKPEKDAIINAMEQAELMLHTPSVIYGDGNTSEKILAIMKEVFSKKLFR